jgi:phenylpyruvate tautomerase PptA (4-oxalocrotonate tautomerase family)
MPFVEILWNKEKVTEEELLEIRDNIPQLVAEYLTRFDPSNIVTPPMVAVRVIEMGVYDQINACLYITVLARYEEPRSRYNDKIIGAVMKGLGNTKVLQNEKDVLVELVLTHHSSSFDYSSLE